MEQPEDCYYIDRIKYGDKEAYTFLVNRYKDMAYTIALKVLRNVEEAEDAVQESFIKAFQGLGAFRGKSKFSTWLYTIVYRTSLQMVKEKRIRPGIVTAELNENYTQDHTAPQILQLQHQQQSRSVRQAINKLPETEGLLVILYYINESSIKEIKDITGFSIPNIKIKLYRARKKLERELQPFL